METSPQPEASSLSLDKSFSLQREPVLPPSVQIFNRAYFNDNCSDDGQAGLGLALATHLLALVDRSLEVLLILALLSRFLEGVLSG